MGKSVVVFSQSLEKTFHLADGMVEGRTTHATETYTWEQLFGALTDIAKSIDFTKAAPNYGTKTQLIIMRAL